MSQVLFLHRTLDQAMAFTTLYCIIGRVLAFDVIIVKHYVDNINCKYTVTMAMTPPTVNMADTLHVLKHTFLERRKVIKRDV